MAHAATLAPKPQELLKSIDAVLGEVPPLPLTQKAWSRQKTETRAGNKVFVWGRGRTFKVRLREGMGTVFKLPDWDSLDQSVLADGVNFRQKEMNNKAMLYVEALMAGADTSLTVVGRSGNIYNFYLASQGVRSETISDQVVDRVDQPVNVRKSPDRRYLVVETINPITLRYGEKTVCLRRGK